MRASGSPQISPCNPLKNVCRGLDATGFQCRAQEWLPCLFPVGDNCSTLQDTVHFLLSSLVRFKGEDMSSMGNEYILYSASFAWKLEDLILF